ncbi:hypothetical protein FQN54_001732 [Arachnomyces sp. PD_36]|nr:hypothetical protein FQN54_001732 [Arachnomyces sp. PD_36]
MDRISSRISMGSPDGFPGQNRYASRDNPASRRQSNSDSPGSRSFAKRRLRHSYMRSESQMSGSSAQHSPDATEMTLFESPRQENFRESEDWELSERRLISAGEQSSRESPSPPPHTTSADQENLISPKAPESRPTLSLETLAKSLRDTDSPHQTPVEATDGFKDRHEFNSEAKSPTSPKSLLQRVGSYRPQRSLTKLSSRSRRERYSALKDEVWDGDTPPTDLSSLGGISLGFQTVPLTEEPGKVSDGIPSPRWSQKHPNRSEQTLVNIGNGPVAETELVYNEPSSTLLPTKASQKSDLARYDTIRSMGKGLAEKNQEVVVISEAPLTVDLSTLDGAKQPEIEPSFSKSSTGDFMNKSYFYPPDPEKPNWKPFSMRSPFIALLILTSLTLAGVQEWLCQRSISLEKKVEGLLSFNSTAEVSLGAFFAWQYMPTMLFVAYGVLWQIADYETKRLEPYYQLSQPNGSTAGMSLNLDYVTMWAYFVPYKAFRYRHWAVLCSAIGSIFATVIAPSLQNPSINFVVNDHCKPDCPDGEFRYFVRVHPVWSRLLTASLAVVAIFGCILFVQLRRKSGLLSDPKGIAGIASMATKSHILAHFQGMDEAPQYEIHKQLRHRRYILHKSTIWQGEYIKQTEIDPYAARKVENPHPIILRLTAGLAFIALLVFCLAFIPIINFTPASVITSALPWLPVLVATIVKQIWTTLEFSVRLIEPFYILSKGDAPPQATLTLDYRGTPYGWVAIKALLNRHFIVSLACFGSILADILTVTVSSFSVNADELISPSHADNDGLTSPNALASEDQTFKSFWTSIALCLVIILFLICSASLIYARRRHPFLPREPSTIASVLAFIYQSRMLYDFIDTERLSNDEMRDMLIKKGKRYGLGWFKGRDGRPHCAVDEEPMLSRYVHGVSYIRATAPWEMSALDTEMVRAF